MRKALDYPIMDKTTVVTNKTLLDRVQIKARMNGETITEFVTRAFVNQLENEGDLDIRKMLEEENNGEADD